MEWMTLDDVAEAGGDAALELEDIREWIGLALDFLGEVEKYSSDIWFQRKAMGLRLDGESLS